MRVRFHSPAPTLISFNEINGFVSFWLFESRLVLKPSAMSKDPAVLLLEHHLKALKLPTLLRDYASVAAVCAQERCDYPQYLLRLTERELIDRERRATERRIKDAQFPVIKTIDTFDFGAQPSVNEPLVRELLCCEYIPKKKNILLVGNPGTGKTHLATARLCRVQPRQTGAVYDHHRAGDPVAGAAGEPHLATPLQTTPTAEPTDPR